MKVLLLGAGGQVGDALATSAPPHVTLVATGRAQCDIGNAAQVAQAVADTTPDIVINAAAYTAVDQAESDLEIARRINGVAPGHIAAAAHRAGARTVHISTDFVFDGRSSRSYQLDDPTGPLSVYGRTKLEGELAVAGADPLGLIVRTSWVYAAVGTNFVNSMLRLMNDKPQVDVVADQIGTPTRASSLASALWALIDKRASGCHHYTDAGVASWYDFAVAIEEEARALELIPQKVRVAPISTDQYPTPARRPAFSVLDKRKTWQLIGETPPHWRVNLRGNLQELKAHG